MVSANRVAVSRSPARVAASANGTRTTPGSAPAVSAACQRSAAWAGGAVRAADRRRSARRPSTTPERAAERAPSTVRAPRSSRASTSERWVDAIWCSPRTARRTGRAAGRNSSVPVRKPEPRARSRASMAAVGSRPRVSAMVCGSGDGCRAATVSTSCVVGSSARSRSCCHFAIASRATRSSPAGSARRTSRAVSMAARFPPAVRRMTSATGADTVPPERAMIAGVGSGPSLMSVPRAENVRCTCRMLLSDRRGSAAAITVRSPRSARSVRRLRVPASQWCTSSTMTAQPGGVASCSGIVVKTCVPERFSRRRHCCKRSDLPLPATPVTNASTGPPACTADSNACAAGIPVNAVAPGRRFTGLRPTATSPADSTEESTNCRARAVEDLARHTEQTATGVGGRRRRGSRGRCGSRRGGRSRSRRRGTSAGCRCGSRRTVLRSGRGTRRGGAGGSRTASGCHGCGASVCAGGDRARGPAAGSATRVRRGPGGRAVGGSRGSGR